MELFSLTNIGLLLDIIGVFLLFVYGLPSKISRSQSVLLIREITPKEKKQAVRIYIMAHFAIVILIAGFILQLLGNIYNGC